MNKKITLSVILLFVSTGMVTAQSFFFNDQLPRFSLIDRSDGLSNLSVSSVVQDSKGFLWMGTQGGLNRYDGRSFKVFRHDPFVENSLPNDLVQTMFLDSERSAIWIGTYNGLSRFDLNTYEFRNFYAGEGENRLSNEVVVAIEQDAHGYVWVGTLDGLNRLDPDSGEIITVETVDPVIRSLYHDDESRLWIGSYGGLEVLDTETLEIRTAEVELDSPFVMSITEMADGRLLLGVWEQGLVAYDPDTQSTTSWTLGDDRVYVARQITGNSIWAGTWGGGLFIITEDGRRFSVTAEDSNGLASNVVYSLLEDEAGLMWVGTNGGGIHKLSPRRRNYRRWYHDPEDPASLPAGKINEIYRDSEGVLWVGIYNGGLNRLGEPDEPVRSYQSAEGDPTSLVNDIVNGITEDQYDNLWVFTNGGLQRFDRQAESFQLWGRDIMENAPLSDDIIYDFLVDSEGRYWIGTYNAGVDRYDPETGELVNFHYDPRDRNSLTNDLVHDVFQDSDGDIWVATNAGLNRFVSEEVGFQRFLHDPEDTSSIPSNTVRKVFEDDRGRIWIATVSGGVARYDDRDGTFAHYSEANGMPSNAVISLEQGNRGRMWFGTQDGIAILDPETEQIDVLDEDAGLFGVEFNEGSWKDDDGTLYFGGSHGITVLSSSTRMQNQHPPRIHISDVQVYQESLGTARSSYNGEEITLDFDQRFVGFEFVALDYESPERNQFAYRLVGFDDEWVYAGTRNYATYTNLPPGRYELQVRAANNDGVWNNDPATLQLTVLPPWYRTWWAFALYTAFLLLIVWGGWRVRAGQILTRQYDELAHTNALLERANAELERLSLNDNLTGLFNRRYFDSRFEEEWQRARRSHRPLGIIMADVDRFKAFNDTYGHVAGDRCLSSVAKVLGDRIARSTDFVARFGGEEFAIVLFETDQDGAALVAERLRKAVEDLAIEHPLAADGSTHGVVTVSFGVYSGIPDDGQKPDDFISMADQALYRAKAAGRNTVRT